MKEIILSTTDSIPNKDYVIIGIVYSNTYSPNHAELALNDLKSKTITKNADAVIQIKPVSASTASFARFFLVGTAVKFTK